MRKLRVYVDTSVIGGCFDDEFADDSKALLEMAKRGEITLLVSEVLFEELANAPQRVKDILATVPEDSLEVLSRSEETDELCDKYLEHKVVGLASTNDARHVAIATVANASMIVSWNFKHIVHYDKMRGFNAINIDMGYNQLQIYCPKEVI